MSFFNPLFLFALAGILVPLLLHFLRRRQVKQVPWAAMRFLKMATEARKRRVQLEDALLMLLRCLALAAVVFALARPWWGSGATAAGGARDVALVIDPSASMEVGGAFQRAVARAGEVVRSAPQGTAFSLVCGSDPVLSPPRVGRREVLDALAGLELERTVFPAFEALGVAAATLEGARNGRAREVVVFTDGQLSGWKFDAPERWAALGAAFDSMLPPPAVRVETIVPEEPVDNVAAVLEIAPGPPPVVGRDLGFLVRVRNVGEVARVPGKIHFRVGGGAVQAAEISSSVLPGAAATVPFSWECEGEGSLVAEAWVGTGDAVGSDDRSEVAFELLPAPRTLVVEGRPGVGLASEKALEAVSGGGVERVPAVGLSGVEAFALYDCILLIEVPRLPRSVAHELRRMVLEGGRLVTVLGEETDIGFMNGWDGVLPAKLLGWEDGAMATEPAGPVVRGASVLVTTPFAPLEARGNFVPFIYELTAGGDRGSLELQSGNTVLELPRGRRFVSGRAGLFQGEGILVPRFSEDTRITYRGGGNARVWVGGKKIIPDGGAGNVELVAEEPVDVKVEPDGDRPADGTGLSWQSASQPWEEIPLGRLHPFPVGTATIAVGAVGDGGLVLRRDGAHLQFEEPPEPGVYRPGNGVPAFVVRQDPDETAVGERLDGTLLAASPASGWVTVVGDAVPVVAGEPVGREFATAFGVAVLAFLVVEPGFAWWVRQRRGGTR